MTTKTLEFWTRNLAILLVVTLVTFFSLRICQSTGKQLKNNELVERELAEYKLEIEAKFKKSQMNKVYKFPRKLNIKVNPQTKIMPNSKVLQDVETKGNKLFIKNRKHLKQKDEGLGNLRSYLGSSMDIDMIKTKESEFNPIPDISAGHAHSIRQAMNRSHIGKHRNYKLSTNQFSDEGSRNRFNLGTEAMWSKLSSK